MKSNRTSKDKSLDTLSFLFHSLQNSKSLLPTESLIHQLKLRGLSEKDPRVIEIKNDIDSESIPYSKFVELIEQHPFLKSALNRDLTIPAFEEFSSIVISIFNYIKQKEAGAVASYIPQLAFVNPHYFGMSLCTLDGQHLDLGDYQTPFCLQSVSKAINYCLALEEYGEAYVHRFIGREPSGRGFNELQLNFDGLPHNPMINAGAIMCCALIMQNKGMSESFEYINKTWEKLSGGHHPGFNEAVYLSERETADRNFALAYFMNEKKKFPKDTNLQKILDLYFSCCSIEMTCESLSIVAATLANGGICPITQEKILSPSNVKNCLSLMQSCGMYDFSGEFSFTVGLPAKSGVSGVLLVVIPGVMGIALFSPKVDSLGNSVRGVEFCKELGEIFNFHPFDSIVKESLKIDPRRKISENALKNLELFLREDSYHF